MTQRLYISFWNVSLQNLPDGTFRRRTLLADEAKTLIDAARREGAVMGVTADDLMAPYKVQELKKHNELSDLLAQRFAIVLPLQTFLSKTREQESAGHFANPLEFAFVSADGRLLVIDCAYDAMKPKAQGQPLEFDIASGSITFHLFETI